MIDIKRIVNKFLRENFLARLISLIIAIILWVYVNYENLPERYMSVPLKIKNIPKHLTIANNIPSNISVKIKGKDDIIQTFSARNIEAYIDLKNGIEGKNIINISTKLKKRSHIRIVYTIPKNVKVVLEKTFRKEVPVSPTIINTPAEGYIKAGETFFPTSVVIEGPASIVREINVIRTKPIDIGGVTGSIYKNVEFDLPNEFVHTVNYHFINIKIKIKQNFSTIFIEKAKINIINFKSNLYIKNKDELFARVKLRGPKSKIETLKKSNNFLYIDLKDIDNGGEYEKRIHYKLPWNCSIVYINHKKVKIKVEEK